MSKLLTVAEVADRLSVVPKTVYKWYWRGELPGVKLGGRCVRIDEAGLQAFLDARRNSKPAPALERPRVGRRAVQATMVFRFLPPSGIPPAAA
jgi:excisionase family DNA binding protein